MVSLPCTTESSALISTTAPLGKTVGAAYLCVPRPLDASQSSPIQSVVKSVGVSAAENSRQGVGAANSTSVSSNSKEFRCISEEIDEELREPLPTRKHLPVSTKSNDRKGKTRFVALPKEVKCPMQYKYKDRLPHHDHDGDGNCIGVHYDGKFMGGMFCQYHEHGPDGVCVLPERRCDKCQHTFHGYSFSRHRYELRRCPKTVDDGSGRNPKFNQQQRLVESANTVLMADSTFVPERRGEPKVIVGETPSVPSMEPKIGVSGGGETKSKKEEGPSGFENASVKWPWVKEISYLNVLGVVWLWVLASYFTAFVTVSMYYNSISITLMATMFVVNVSILTTLVFMIVHSSRMYGNLENPRVSKLGYILSRLRLRYVEQMLYYQFIPIPIPEQVVYYLEHNEMEGYPLQNFLDEVESCKINFNNSPSLMRYVVSTYKAKCLTELTKYFPKSTGIDIAHQTQCYVAIQKDVVDAVVQNLTFYADNHQLALSRLAYLNLLGLGDWKPP